MSSAQYQRVVIIGAPRSGTKMLRDLLTEIAGFATWPCDEINFIWRYKNARYPTDELPVAFATANVRRYIRRQFDWVARRYGCASVVEKTCANSLRVAFVEAVLEAPKYIFIYRDGVDAVASAIGRWQASLDLRYTLAKARFVPLAEIPYYGLRFLRNRIHRLTSPARQLRSWGPVSREMRALGADASLVELCAHQWAACVQSALAALEQIPQERVLRISYEGLLRDAPANAERLAAYLGLGLHDVMAAPTFSRFRVENIGKGRAALASRAVSTIETIGGRALEALGYL